MKNKKNLTCLAMVGLGLHASAAILTSDNFETDLGNWSVAEGNAGHYLYDDTSTDPNYATTGDGAAFVQATWGEGVLGLTNSLALDTNEATSVTISLDYIWDSTSSTRFVYIDYSTDGGTNWTDSIGSNGGWGTFSASTA